MAKIRDCGDVLGFGAAAVLFLPRVAYLGITNGHQFIANDFFAFMYCLARCHLIVDLGTDSADAFAETGCSPGQLLVKRGPSLHQRLF
ncbi:hypothetical protein [Streptomyces sp. NBC_01207]|uniref:hypothetical protein n=1 Tax=Streptomyces sp. NBC_01207 TaxID=2903772 RepID=UPI002E13241F|nr:hypothetical protein OG457_00210 [Streptomyces sp. NBC_01207]